MKYMNKSIKKSKGHYLRMCQYTGIILFIASAIIGNILKNDATIIIALIGALLGFLLVMIPGFIGKCVYVCPNCKVKFDRTDDKVYLALNGWRGIVLLTCPKCKRTNFMRNILISREEYKQIDKKFKRRKRNDY